jgi:hypothetical protein
LTEDLSEPTDLLTQSAAREQARKLNEGWNPPGMVNVAHAVPIGSWGGHEKGWSVSLVPAPTP